MVKIEQRVGGQSVPEVSYGVRINSYEEAGPLMDLLLKAAKRTPDKSFQCTIGENGTKYMIFYSIDNRGRMLFCSERREGYENRVSLSAINDPKSGRFGIVNFYSLNGITDEAYSGDMDALDAIKRFACDLQDFQKN